MSQTLLLLISETSFKDYEPVEFLGSGGFGIVMKCKHKLDNKEYAVKIIQLPRGKKHRNEIEYDTFLTFESLKIKNLIASMCTFKVYIH